MGLLYEFEGKQIFRSFGIPLPKSKLVESAEDAVAASEELGLPVVIKAQVSSGKRGKRGLIKIAKTEDEVLNLAKEILSKESDGKPIKRLLIEETVNIDKELYMSITVDGARLQLLGMLSAEGGVDIEELAKNRPEAISKISFALDEFIQPYQFIPIVKAQGFEGKIMVKIANIFATLAQMVSKADLTLAEINPLVITKEGNVIALDSKVITDDNAIYRHKSDWGTAASLTERYTREELEAKKHGIAYVELEGEIGTIACGAGLAMTTTDLLQYFGGKPKNFLDVGGGASPEKVEAALKIISEDPHVKGILVNVFGGITRCDLVAEGIVSALKKYDIKVPMVVRFMGTNQDEGVKLLAENGIEATLNMEEAIKKIVELVYNK